jgi:hypothetical protein
MTAVRTGFVNCDQAAHAAPLARPLISRKLRSCDEGPARTARRNKLRAWLGGDNMAERLARTRNGIPLSSDVLNMLIMAAAAVAVVALGFACAAAVPDKASPWLSLSAFAAPAGLAFLAYWWMDQRP